MNIRPFQYIIIVTILSVFGLHAHAESVDPKDNVNVTLQNLVDRIQGDGVTISNPVFSGDDAQAGLYNGYSFLLGNDFDSGVLISSGTAVNVVGSNTSGQTTTDFPGGSVNDPDLGGSVFDPVKLTMDVVPTENTLIVDYVFGSEEYDEYVGSNFNDNIRVLVNGNNCALTADGQIVSINAVNNSTNAFLYTDNTPEVVPTQMDGYTSRISCRFSVVPNTPVSVVIGLADVFDGQWDSWAFIRAQSLRSEPSDEFGDAPDSYQTLLSNNGAAHVIVEGLSLGELPDGDLDGFHDGIDDSAGAAADDANDDGVITFPNLVDTDTTYSINVEGTSINGSGADIIAWIDFDRNGSFEADEASNIATLADGDYQQSRVLSWSNIGGTGPDIVGGATYARVRIVDSGSGIGPLNMNGAFASGEVEDYILQISGLGDNTAPVVTIDTPPVVTTTNQTIYTVSGSCTASDNNVFVDISNPTNGAEDATPPDQFVICSGGGKWTATFDVSAISDGIGVIAVDASQQDANNNTGNAVQQVGDKDVNGPTVSILNVPAITNSVFTATFEFNEDVTGFTLGEITVGNGTASSFIAVDANTYTADITPTADGNVSIDVAANVAQDAANNNNTVATQVTTVYDSVAPVVAITSAPLANAANAASYQVDGSCSNGDGGVSVSIPGATPATQLATCTAGNWSTTFDVSAIGDALNAVTVDASQTDTAGNVGNAATIQADKEADVPGVDIQGEPAFANSLSAFNVTFEFTEAVTGFVVADITVSNGAASDFTVVDANTYTADITPGGGGDIAIDVAAAVAQDGAANANTAAVQAVVSFDNVAPVVTINSTPVANAANFTSYPVSGSCETTEGNVTVGIIGATPVSQAVVCSSNSWSASFDLSAIADGSNVITVNASQTDAFLNTGNATPAQADKDVVIAIPTVDILLTNNVTPILTGTAEAGSAVVVSVAGATYNTVATGAGTWSIATATPDAGTFSPDVNGVNAVLAISTDAANNSASDVSVDELTIDTTQPAVTISGAPAATNAPSFDITITFTEAVNNFVIGDIIASNATVSAFAGGPAIYTATITPTGGDITLEVSAAVATDGAGNNNTAATQVNVVYDTTAPGATITGAPASTNDTPFGISITFDEDVSGFVLADIIASNATVANFAGGPAVYTATVTPTGGAITLDVNAAVATDASGNDNTAAAQVSVAYDVAAPGVVISGAPAVTNATAFPITVTFSEAVNNFVAADIIASNATVSAFAGGPAVYTATVTPGGGAITIDVNAAVATDGSGNDNTAATQVNVAFDNVAPTVAITGAPSISNNDPFDVTITFSEAVNNFIATDVSVTNATVTAVAGGPAVYTATIAPTGGAMTLDVNAAVANDDANNGNAAATTVNVAYDATAPGVVISGAPATTNNTAFNITVTFSEAVNNFVQTDISASNATVSALAGGPAVFTATVTPTGGAISLDVNAAVASDDAGNANSAAATVNVAYDNTAPSTVISGAPANSNDNPFAITITFSEDVSNFEVGDITAGNATVSGLAGGPAVYTATVTPSGGAISLDVNAAVATDASGNANTAATTVNVAYDNTVPGVTISGAPVTTNNSPFTITITFSEDVNDFVATDISAVNAGISGFAGGPAVYTATVTPSGGAIALDVNAGVASDAAGNTNTAATTVNVAYDVDAPTVAITGAPATTNATPFDVTITFSEAVSDFIIGDIAVSNATLSTLVGGPSSYTVTVTPTGGAVSLDVNAGVASDASGNTNTAAATVNVAYDNTATNVIISGAPAVTNSSPFGITITFSEDVNNFVAGDITVTNAALSGFAGGPAIYTATVTPSGGAITLDVAAAVATDNSGNPNTAAAQVAVAYDATAPTVVISGAPATTNNSQFNITVTFSEAVNNFVAGDISAVNASIGGFVGGPSVYTATVTPAGGAITLDVNAAAASDDAGNTNTAAATVNVAYDNAAPSVAISGAPVTTNNTPFGITITFSEDVIDFVVSDITAANATLSGFAGGPAIYTATVTPTGGDITLGVNAAVASDASGNANTAAANVNVSHDALAPTVAITGAPTVTNDSAFGISITFSEDVSGFVIGDITAGNAAVSGLAGGPAVYTATVTPTGGDISLDINAGIASDASGNANTAAATVNVTHDIVAPGIDIQGEPASVNTLSAFTVSFVFTEDVSGFDVTDIMATNAAISNLSVVTASSYTADITPNGADDITIDVAADRAQDNAGNGNTIATQAVITFDNAVPAVSIQNAPVSVNTLASYTVNIAFTEDVSGFDVTDIVLVNASASNFVTINASSYSVDVTPDGNGSISIDIAAGAAQDIAANASTAAATVTTVFDNTPPLVDITSPQIVNIANQNAYTVSGTCTVGDSDVAVFMTIGALPMSANPNPSCLPGGVWSTTFDLSTVTDGVDHINIGAQQTDAAGNTGNAPFVLTSKDTVRPSVQIQNVPATVNASEFVITIAFDEAVSGFTSTDVSVTNATVNAASFVALDAQTYTVGVTASGVGAVSLDVVTGAAQDLAGNGNNAASTVNTGFDNVAPVVSIVTAATVNAANAGNYTVDGSCTAGDGDVTVSIVGATPVSQLVICGAGNWTASFDVSAIADGSNAVTVDASQTDAAANTSNAASVSADKDVVIAVPTVTLLTTNSTTPVISGSAEADSGLTVVVAGATYTITTDSAGNWSLDTAIAVPDSGAFALLAGSNEVTVSSTDAVGNTASDASVNEITLTLDDDNDGIPNAVECPTGPPFDNTCPDSDGDGIPDFQDTDSDNDGIDDATEVGQDPNNPIDSDGDGIPDFKDTDSDNDGIDDAIETVTDSDGDGIPDYVDIGNNGDSDGDGIPDSVECLAYPACPDSDADGQPDYLETDSDNDGLSDAVEAGVDPTAPVDTDGDGTPDYQDVDSDNDGTNDSVEGSGDADSDGIPDYVDPASAGPGAGDSDGDGIADNIECALYPLCADSDNDGTLDYMETDSDNDGIDDTTEAGINGNDGDNDGIDDAIDADVTGGLDLDNDGVDDSLPLDTDGDGIPDYQDNDSNGNGVDDATEGTGDADNDGIPDYLDGDSSNAANTTDGSGDSDGDGISDLDECLGGLPCPDVDQDGKPDYMDAVPTDGPTGDNDNDGVLNYLDPDDDNDNIPDVVEDPDFDADNNPSTNPLDTDADGTPDYLDVDSDNDGLSDAVESGASGNDADSDGIDDSYDVDVTGGNDANNDGIDDDVRPLDSDGDSLPDYLDTVFDGDPNAADTDGDGIPDAVECPTFPSNCPDTDNDGTPDFLEVDADNDGLLDVVEVGNKPGVPVDSDGDGTPDYQDTDSDNDGIDDSIEMLSDADADGIPDYVDIDTSGNTFGGDSDGDGVEDLAECSRYPACADSDGDRIPDYMDADSQPYDPNDAINTGLKGAGSNGPWSLLLIMLFAIAGRAVQTRPAQAGCVHDRSVHDRSVHGKSGVRCRQ